MIGATELTQAESMATQRGITYRRYGTVILATGPSKLRERTGRPLEVSSLWATRSAYQEVSVDAPGNSVPWALLSTAFAAANAKVGVQGVDSDLATLVRTLLI